MPVSGSQLGSIGSAPLGVLAFTDGQDELVEDWDVDDENGDSESPLERGSQAFSGRSVGALSGLPQDSGRSQDQGSGQNGSSGESSTASALFLSQSADLYGQGGSRPQPGTLAPQGVAQPLRSAPPPYSASAPPPSSGSPAPPSANSGPPVPQSGDRRPPGDTRSAQQIIDDNPTLKNLGNQSHVQDNLKKQVGDWTDPKLSPDERADAAYRASEVLNYIKSSNASDGTKRSDSVTKSGTIDGFTKSGDARHGTEAGLLQDFGKYGYSVLASSNHNLPKTDDPYVNKDGTTQSNAQHAGHVIVAGLKKIAEVFLKVVKVVEDVASKIEGFIGDLKIPGISQAFAVASVATETVSQGANVADTALEGGNVKEAAKQAGENVAETAVSALTVPGAGKALGEGAKSVGEDLTKRTAKEGAKQASAQQEQANVQQEKAKGGSAAITS